MSRVRALIRLADAPAWSAPAIVGLGLLSAMLEGLWLRLMMGTEDVTREIALKAATEFLAAVFPKHYTLDAKGIRTLK